MNTWGGREQLQPLLPSGFLGVHHVSFTRRQRKKVIWISFWCKRRLHKLSLKETCYQFHSVSYNNSCSSYRHLPSDMCSKYASFSWWNSSQNLYPTCPSKNFDFSTDKSMGTLDKLASHKLISGFWASWWGSANPATSICPRVLYLPRGKSLRKGELDPRFVQ